MLATCLSKETLIYLTTKLQGNNLSDQYYLINSQQYLGKGKKSLHYYCMKWENTKLIHLLSTV